MDYLLTISPQGIKTYYETYNISSIQLMQPVGINGSDRPHYIVVITYDNGQKEQAIISDETWQLWNMERNKNENR